MAERRSLLGWASFINMACIKSVIDLQHYVQQGSVDTWFHGWLPANEHPIAIGANVIFDAGSVVGLLLTIKGAVGERRRPNM